MASSSPTSPAAAPIRLKPAQRSVQRRAVAMHPPAAAALDHLSKGQQTRSAIVDQALSDAARIGLAGLSIGSLADALGMSKSGVFAHFGSKEELQLAVLAEYHRRFERDVFMPALQAPAGLPRLRSLFEGWMQRVSAEAATGCLYIGGAAELDDQPGPVRDALNTMAQSWLQALARAVGLAVQAGHLRAATDVSQWVFELQGLILALHYDARFLRAPGGVERARAGFDRLLQLDAAHTSGHASHPSP